MWWVPGGVPIKISKKILQKYHQEDKNMLKLYTRKLKKAWEDTATPITVNKREMNFGICPVRPDRRGRGHACQSPEKPDLRLL